ncbi:MAG: hypothetical protein IKG18_16995 [Atopobiaceae bacterium]|nr:hypothetical protein [Atopobiaceae bacterium]
MSHMSPSLLAFERNLFHTRLCESGLLVVDGEVASNADSSSRSSREIALHLARILDAPREKKLRGQTSGAVFERELADYIARTFRELQQLRPGDWHVANLGNRGHRIAEGFAQYEHLAHLAAMVEKDSELRMAIGNDYVVSPDIVVWRGLVSDDDMNEGKTIVEDGIAGAADLRASNGGKPILHASISAKWTIRSDRAQNSRTEALNLIRNRKGRLPHIVVVTGEPLPSRLASLALGTGDIDCVYHVALYELQQAVEQYSQERGVDDSLDALEALIMGRRLKDISDLPLDLCV